MIKMQEEIKCVKGILNYISDNTSYDTYATFHSIIQNSEYDKEMTLKMIYQCESDCLFGAVEHLEGAPDTGRIYSLSPDGRTLLKKLNSNTIVKIASWLLDNKDNINTTTSWVKTIISLF